MVEDRLPRKLVAILYADVAAYSRLTGVDEDTTHRNLAEYLDLVSAAVESHHGQVMHYAGDAVLAKFDAVVDALSSAVALQEELKDRNHELPDECKVQFRIGVNLGDVIEDRGDIYGDGVNVSARLESLADPGGICVSESVRTAIGKKLDLAFEFMGEQEVKNITEPVRAYKVVLASKEGAQAAVHRVALDLPDKPSIAVLPFTNMSADPEQEYFSDGITEDIITELSRFRSLFVIARSSSFHYKGQSPTVQIVGHELGVQYVVEGSVRKAANSVRITAQLVDTSDGTHLWAERYDRELKDIFTLQDEVVQAIASAIPNRIKAVATGLAHKKSTTNLTAYDNLLRGEWEWWRDNDRQALAYFEKAVEIDPQCARAFARMAVLHGYGIFSLGTAVEAASRSVRGCAERAIEIDDGDASILAMVSTAYSQIGDYDRARATLERALTLNPHDAEVMYRCGLTTTYQGDPLEALKWLHKAMQLNPYYPESWLEVMMEAYFISRQYDKALEIVKKYGNPPFHLFAQMAAIYAQLGLTDDSKKSQEMFEQAKPDDFNFKAFAMASLNVFRLQEHRELWLEGYRNAGFEV